VGSSYQKCFKFCNAVQCQFSGLDQTVVNGVVPDPKPYQTFYSLLGHRPVMQSNSRGVNHTDLFKPQGWVSWITLEEVEILVSKILNFIRKLPIGKPKIGSSKMLHRMEQRPDSKSLSALAANLANRPLNMSSSIFSSHLSEVYCSNQSEKICNSWGGSFFTACSNSRTLMDS